MRLPLSRLVFALAVTAAPFLALPCEAAGNPSGVNMRWNDCYSSPNGRFNRIFACNTNVGSHSIYLSVVNNAQLENISGCEFTIQVSFSSGTIPAWWQFINAGSCRRTSLTISSSFITDTCEDLWQGQATGGIGAYNVDYYGPGTARIRAVIAVPVQALATLNADTEVIVGRFNINSASTVGTGSCAGCRTAVCLAFLDAKLTTPVPANDVTLAVPALANDSHWVSWGDGTVTSLVPFQCTAGSIRGLRVSAP